MTTEHPEDADSGKAMRTHINELHPGLIDGRQSPTALAIARGTMRMLSDLGYTSLSEFTLASGRRTDLVALSNSGEIWIVEIKSSVEDFKSDHKWQDYLDYCDRFYFAVDQAFPTELIPEQTGLIIADKFGAAIVRDNAESKLAAARRKAMTLAIARNATSRLHRLADPDAKFDAGSRF